MTKSKQKFTRKSVFDALRLFPTYKYLEILGRNKIFISAERDWNEAYAGAELELVFLPDCVRFQKGRLTMDEQFKTYSYKDYSSASELAEDLGGFIVKYFGSFRWVRKVYL